MIPGAKKKYDIQFGDLVELVYDVTSYGNKKLYGRVYARISPRHSSSIYRNKQTYYIIKPEPKFEKDIEGKDDLLEALLFMMDPNPGLDWGRVPPQPYLAVPEQRLAPLFADGMLKRFKQNGLCPRCGDAGYWKALALFCNWHGRFL